MCIRDSIWSALGATDGFALLNLEEAITLRERGWKGPILMLEGFFHAQDLEIYDQHRLTTCVPVSYTHLFIKSGTPA